MAEKVLNAEHLPEKDNCISADPALNSESRSSSLSSKTGTAVSQYTFDDLRYRFETGRSFVKSGEGRDRKYGYRTGVMTKIGDIEISEWRGMMMVLIEESGELELLEQLKRWAEKSCTWLHSKQKIEDYALELHSNRIFDNPNWACFEEFNQDYRPKEKKQIES